MTESSSVTKCESGEDKDAEINNSQTPLEWNFIDFTKAKRSPIFDVDPLFLKKFIGHNVTVSNSSNEKFHGCCLAIDPVSLSVILARRRRDENKIRIITLPGYHLRKIYVNPLAVPSEEQVSVNDLDIVELYHANNLLQQCNSNESETGKNSADPSQTQPLSPNSDSNNVDPPPSFSGEDIKNRKEVLKSLLAKNFLPCTEKGDELQLPGGIKILPPYTIDTCDTNGNKIILKKLGDLINTMQKLG